LAISLSLYFIDSSFLVPLLLTCGISVFILSLRGNRRTIYFGNIWNHILGILGVLIGFIMTISGIVMIGLSIPS
jgi:hypothetical protein